MNRALVVLVFVFNSFCGAAVLSGSYEIKNAAPGAPREFRFPDQTNKIYVIHHIGVQFCCGGVYTAPVAGAQWFDRFDQDFAVAPTSRVQTLDVGALDDDLLYKWWIDNTSPTHPFIADPDKILLKQLNAGESWPEVLVVDCNGRVAFHAEQEMDEKLYQEVKSVIRETLLSASCPL